MSTTMIISFIVGVLAVKIWDLPKYITIKRSAFHLGLRDKGEIEPFYEDDRHLALIHSDCNTRVRIGINKQSHSVNYCWRCETIFTDSSYVPGPDGGEEIPVGTGADDNVVVVPFPVKKAG